MKRISKALYQNTGICWKALQDCASKLSKSFESVIIEVLLLHMVIPGKIYFTQMGGYSEQCYSQYFRRQRSKIQNWLRFNVALAMHYIALVKRYHKELLKLSLFIVADAFFATSTCYEGIHKQGFHHISRFSENAHLCYLY